MDKGDTMTQLMMVTVGGKVKDVNMEVHDVQFVQAADLESTYDVLKERWYGVLDGLHIDSYMVVEHIDGYDVKVTETVSDQENHLFLVNVGGYTPGKMLEEHDIKLYVGTDEKSVKQRVMAEYKELFNMRHVDKIVNVNELVDGHIQLTKVEGKENSEVVITGFHRI